MLLANGPFAMAYGMTEGTPHDVRIHMRGEPEQPGSLVRRGLIKALGGGRSRQTREAAAGSNSRSG